MRIENTTNTPKKPFKGFIDITTKVQENTLLNRGIVDIGGCAIPQALMSNNKDEAIERGSLSLLYFVLSICTPFFMLPFLNKKFLASSGLVKDFKGLEKDIMKVSKEYLTQDASYLLKGIKEKGIYLDAEKLVNEGKKQGKNLDLNTEMKRLKDNGLKLEHQNAFENLLNRYKGKQNELKEKLAKVHKDVFKYDFLTTAWMWCAAPYVATEITEKRTHKKGFSAAFDMVDQSKYDEKKYNNAKKKKMLTSALIATIPPLITPKLLMKSLTKGNLRKYASSFDYSEGMFMSKSIFALMWLLCDYPSALVSARDKMERKDRAIRFGALFVMFFGGDFAINNIIGRTIDKFAKTKIMKRTDQSLDVKGVNRAKQFMKDFTLLPRNFSELNSLAAPKNVIDKTKKYGAALYWFALLANCALIGFALPAGLNKMLKNSVKRDHSKSENQLSFSGFSPMKKNTYEKFGF